MKGRVRSRRVASGRSGSHPVVKGRIRSRGGALGRGRLVQVAATSPGPPRRKPGPRWSRVHRGQSQPARFSEGHRIQEAPGQARGGGGSAAPGPPGLGQTPAPAATPAGPARLLPPDAAAPHRPARSGCRWRQTGSLLQTAQKRNPSSPPARRLRWSRCNR